MKKMLLSSKLSIKLKTEIGLASMLTQEAEKVCQVMNLLQGDKMKLKLSMIKSKRWVKMMLETTHLAKCSSIK